MDAYEHRYRSLDQNGSLTSRVRPAAVLSSYYNPTESCFLGKTFRNTLTEEFHTDSGRNADGRTGGRNGNRCSALNRRSFPRRGSGCGFTTLGSPVVFECILAVSDRLSADGERSIKLSDRFATPSDRQALPFDRVLARFDRSILLSDRSILSFDRAGW